MPALTRDGDVFTLDLGDGENRFNPSWVGEVLDAVAEVDAAEGPRALLLVARGKIWSNGLDLDWMMANRDEVPRFIGDVQELLARMLELSAPSIALIQGHCFAAGALLALTCDIRLMRADRGYFCLPEVDIDIPFSPGMSAMIQAKLSPQAAHEAMTTGRRYGGEEAAGMAIVDGATSEEALVGAGASAAERLAPKAGPTLKTIRSQMYRGSIDLLRQGAAIQIPGI